MTRIDPLVKSRIKMQTQSRFESSSKKPSIKNFHKEKFRDANSGLDFHTTTLTSPMGHQHTRGIIDRIDMSVLDDSIVNYQNADLGGRNLRNAASSGSINNTNVNTRRVMNLKPNALNSDNKIIVLG